MDATQEVTMTLAKLGYADVHKIMDTLPIATRATVDQLWSQAVTYVHGWQDAGGDEHNSTVALDFGMTYGMHAARYAAELVGYRRCLRTAFQRYRAGMPIED